jgi:hypothetical protein
MIPTVADQFWTINEPFHDLMGTINLAVQVLLLIMLYLGVRYKHRNNVNAHGNVMVLVVIVAFISAALVMTPSILYYYVSEPTKLGYSFGKIHGILGGAAIILALGMTAPWVIGGTNTRACAGKRMSMIITTAALSLAILTGLMEFVIHVVLNI